MTQPRIPIRYKRRKKTIFLFLHPLDNATTPIDHSLVGDKNEHGHHIAD
jgi:hypothetical protein